MGDITPVKVLIVAVIALLVLGPEKLPEMMRKAGKAWADFRSFRENMEAQVRETVGDVPGLSDLTKLTKFTNVGIKSTIASSLNSAMSTPTTIAAPSDPPLAPAIPSAAAPTTVSAARGTPTSGVVTEAGDGRSAGPAARPRTTRVGSGEPVFSADDPSFN